MRPCVLLLDVSGQGYVPVVRSLAERGISVVMNGTATALQARAEGVPVRPLYVPPSANAVVNRQLSRIAGELGPQLERPDVLAAFSSPLGDFLPHTGSAFFQQMIQLVGLEISVLETLESLTAECRLRGEELRLIVLAADNHAHQRALVLGARRHGIPTLQLAHGSQFVQSTVRIAGEMHTVYADRVASFARRDRDVLTALGNDPERIHLTGSPAWDHLYRRDARMTREEARRRLGLDPGRQVVLFCTSYAEGSSAFYGRICRRLARMYSAVLAASAHPELDFQLIVRPHPAELARVPLGAEVESRVLASHAAWLADRAGPGACLLRDRKEEAIQAADLVVVGTASTLLTEAMILERPSVVLPLFPEDDHRFLARGGVEVLDDENALPSLVASLLGDTQRLDELVGRQNMLLPELNEGNDGRAAERVADLIAELAQVDVGSAPPAGPPARPDPERAPEVSVVIPVFNRVDHTLTCLETLPRARTDVPYEVIVVDNASTDGTAALLAEHEAAGRIRVVRNAVNLGFAAACNQGAEAARAPHLLFLNNDTVPTDGWLDALLDAVSPGDVGAVGARLLYPDGTIQHAGISFVEGVPDHPFRFAPADAAEVRERRELDMVTGACLLLPAGLFARLGGFDTAYRNGVEDVDLCLRVRAAGYRVLYEPRAVVYHYEGQSSGRFDHVSENLRIFIARWGDRIGPDGRFIEARPPAACVEGARAFAVLAFADEIVASPELLRVYGAAFGKADDATLVIHAAGWDGSELGARLGPAVSAAGLEAEASADLLAVASAGDAAVEVTLARRVDALFSRVPRSGPLRPVPRFDDASIAELRRLAERRWAA